MEKKWDTIDLGFVLLIACCGGIVVGITMERLDHKSKQPMSRWSEPFKTSTCEYSQFRTNLVTGEVEGRIISQ